MEARLQCPVQTPTPGTPGQEVRAYKLGKKRWSYNQVELVLTEQPAGNGGTATSGRRAAVQQALHTTAKFPEAHQDSAVAFVLQLESGLKLQAHVYLCYDASPADSTASGVAGRARGPAPASSGQAYWWHLVSRQHCCKGCQGRVLRSIQRFGRVGKRASSGGGEGEGGGGPSAGPATGMRKDPRFMYLSMDEACTHVDAAAFRLVAGVYNRQGTKLLGTAVSPPIRVLANNDVPTGAARISLEAQLPSDWEGWAAEAAGAALTAAEPPASPTLATPRPARQDCVAATRRRCKAKARSGTRGASRGGPPAADAPVAGTQDSSDLSHGLSTPEVMDALVHSSSMLLGSAPSPQPQPAPQQPLLLPLPLPQPQQSLASFQLRPQQPLQQVTAADLTAHLFGSGGMEEGWSAPLHQIPSPSRRQGPALQQQQQQQKQLPRSISMPAAVAGYLADSSGEGSGSGGVEHACGGRRLRRRLTMPGVAEQHKVGSAASAEHVGQPAILRPEAQPQQWLVPAPLSPEGAWRAAGDTLRPAAGGGDGAGERAAAELEAEAERQLRLLGQLKAHVQAAWNEADSSVCPAPSPRGPSPAAALPPLCSSPSAAAAEGPCASPLAPNVSASSLLAEDSCLMLENNLGLPLLGPADDDASGLHMALMGPEVELLNITALFGEDEAAMLCA